MIIKALIGLSTRREKGLLQALREGSLTSLKCCHQDQDTHLPRGEVDGCPGQVGDDDLEVGLDGVHVSAHLLLDTDLAEVRGDRVEATSSDHVHSVLHSFLQDIATST